MKVIEFLRRLIEAWRHVRSGGRTTRTTATKRATAPPRRCTECRQIVPRSTDWRDHIH